MYSSPSNHDQQTIQTLIRDAKCYPPEREWRIARDISECCRNFPGVSPKHDYYQHENQVVCLVVLNGTIPIIYRQNTYHIPVCIVCRPLYPNDPPVAYVRPTATMQLNDRLRHGLYSMNSDGRVYFRENTYTWDSSEFDLYTLLVVMRRVFSQEPPVLAKQTHTVQPSEEPERSALLAELTRRLENTFSTYHEKTHTSIINILQKQDEIRREDEHANDEGRQRCAKINTEKDINHRLTIQKKQLTEWKEEMGDIEHERDLQELLQYIDIFEHQIAECKSKDLAHTDALDTIDEACARNVIDHETYIRHIRNISGEQFYIRALKAKVEMARANQPSDEGAVSRAKTTRQTPLYAS